MTLDRRAASARGGMLLTLASACSAAAQTASQIDDLRRELEAVKQGQAAILKEIQDLRTLILGASRQSRGAPAQSVRVDQARFLGQPQAPVTIVEFTDFQCPFCARYVRDVFPQIERDYIRTGKVKYVVRDFPITGLHPQAFKGHEAARCAGDQGKFWEMHRRLFAEQKAMAVADLEAHAAAIGLDAAKFRACLGGDKQAGLVRADLEDGSRAGVTGTPTFMLGHTEPAAPALKVARVLTGAQPYERFKEAIDALLTAPK